MIIAEVLFIYELGGSFSFPQKPATSTDPELDASNSLLHVLFLLEPT